MATYDYNWVIAYTTNNGGLTWTTTGNGTALSGTLSDGQGAGVGDFDFTDTITDSNLGGTFDYYGSANLLGSGDDYPAMQLNPNEIFFYGNLPDPNNAMPPADIADQFISANPFTTCFAAGTLIETAHGERAVETLEIGDLIQSAEGRAVMVKWIGRQTLHKLFTPKERFEPVRVRTGALGQGLPHTDLVLTADHALILDGLAICAGALVNGTTITRDPKASLPDRVTYYHIETEAHDVILANGAAAETYVDYVQRSAFDNHAEYLELYGEDRTIPEMDLPRISAGRHVPQALRARLSKDSAA